MESMDWFIEKYTDDFYFFILLLIAIHIGNFIFCLLKCYDDYKHKKIDFNRSIGVILTGFIISTVSSIIFSILIGEFLSKIICYIFETKEEQTFRFIIVLVNTFLTHECFYLKN